MRRWRRCSVEIAGYDGHRLQLRAPLALHVNDKGCAFGGKPRLDDDAGLLGAGVAAFVEAAGLQAEVFVADSQIPLPGAAVRGPGGAAEQAPESNWPGFIATLRERGRARTGVVARALLPDGGVCDRVHRALRGHRQVVS
jgi:hypothetical protein